MYINGWNGGHGLGENDYQMEYPGEAYPSGGPTTTMHDLYKAVAKSIDISIKINTTAIVISPIDLLKFILVR